MSELEHPYKISNFIQDIVSKNIVQFNKTELASGRSSSYYADFRQLLGYTYLTNYVVGQIIKIIETIEATGTKYDIIAGVAVAGVPWATLVGNKLNKPVSIIRLNEKTHGKKSAIDGAPIKFEDRVILIEDVLTTGGSVLKAIRKITNTGAEIVRVISLLDRNEGAQEHIKYYFPDIKISSILSIDTLVSVCSANKLIPDYIAEQIEFYRESGYTETIKMLTKLNEDAKEKEFQKDPVTWHINNYSDVWNIIPVDSIEDSTDVNNALFVNVSKIYEWNEIKYKINVLGNRLRNLVIMFECIQGWNGTKQEELVALQQKYGFNIIYNSHEVIPQSIIIDSSVYTIYNNLNTITPNCKYPNSVFVNGIILNLYVDNNHEILMNQLRDALKKYDNTTEFTNLNIRNIFINLIGPGIDNIITEREFWCEFTNYFLSILNNQHVQIKGIIMPYASLKRKPDIFLRYKDLGRMIPLILDVSNPFDFHLDPSMLTDKTETDYVESLYCITKVFNGNSFTHLMVGGDLMQSNTVVDKRIEHYIKFMNTLVNSQKRKLGPVQIFEKMNQLLKDNKHAITATSSKDFIKSKIDSFCQKKNVEEAITHVPKENKPTPSSGFYDKCKGYLLNTTNNVLGLFGLTLASKS